MPISVVSIVKFTHTNFKTLHSSLPSSKHTKKLNYVAFVINYRHALIIDRKCINYHHYKTNCAPQAYAYISGKVLCQAITCGSSCVISSAESLMISIGFNCQNIFKLTKVLYTHVHACFFI